MRKFHAVAIVAIMIGGWVVSASEAQPLGLFRWQLHPYCNIVSVAVTQQGGQYQLDGTDDQCGAAQAASVRGMAFQNPNGTIGFGLTIVTAPGGAPVHVDATVAIATLSGTWRDSAGNNGTFTFTPGVGTGGDPRPVRSGSLTLNPYAVALSDGATLVQSGFVGPLRLPDIGRPAFATGFTIPNDYVTDTPLVVRILWETPATACTFELRPNLLFRAGEGLPRDFGNAAGGLTAASASTSFTLSTNGGLIMEAPATAHTTARMTFNIVPTPVEFPSLRPGDAINLGFFRPSESPDDTCAADLGVARMSVLYTTP